MATPPLFREGNCNYRFFPVLGAVALCHRGWNKFQT